MGYQNNGPPLCLYFLFYLLIVLKIKKSNKLKLFLNFYLKLYRTITVLFKHINNF